MIAFYTHYVLVKPVDSEHFMKLYSSLPLKERDMTIVVIDGEPMSWRRAYEEIRAQTTLGEAIFNKLIELKIL